MMTLKNDTMDELKLGLDLIEVVACISARNNQPRADPCVNHVVDTSWGQPWRLSELRSYGTF